MKAQTKWRFIANAKCPKCDESDVLQYRIVHDDQQMRCVQCGHHENLSPKDKPDPEKRLIVQFKV